MYFSTILFFAIFPHHYYSITCQIISNGADDYRQTEKVNVTVFYETLCYESVSLIHRQLYPTWLSMNDYFNLIFIPYGKSVHNKDRNGRIHFLCHHGPRECYGNRIQACALAYLDTNSAVHYVACFMTYNNVFPYRTNCFEEINKNPENLGRFNVCVNTTEGDEVLAKLGDLTLSIDPRFTTVPAVAFNGVYDLDMDQYSRKNFKSALCRVMNISEADACTRLN